MLRDAGEAQRLRIEALERELDDIRRETEPLRERAARADDAEKSAARLEREVQSLRAQLAPQHAARLRSAGVAVVALIVLGMGIAAFAFQAIADARREAAVAMEESRRATEAREAESAARIAAIEAELEQQRERATAAQHRIEVLDDELAVERTAEAELRAERSFVAVDLPSRTVRVEGRDDLRGSSCDVALSPSGGECRARVTCGGTEIYPSPGHGGYFSCEVRDGHLVRGRDVNGTAASGDPMLDVDGARGAIVVSDGPSPAWVVRITTDAI